MYVRSLGVDYTLAKSQKDITFYVLNALYREKGNRHVSSCNFCEFYTMQKKTNGIFGKVDDVTFLKRNFSLFCVHHGDTVFFEVCKSS